MTLTQINKAGLDELALDHVFTIGASGTDHYTFQGEGLNGTVNDPTLYLTRGKTYRFENGSGGHPIRIQSTSGASGTAYNTGVTNNAGSGTVIVEVQHDAPDVLYYQCTSHANMNGILYITGALADGGVTTDKLAADAVTAAKLADNAVVTANITDDAVTDAKLANSINSAIAANTAKNTNATHTGDVTGSGSLTIASNAVTTAKIADDAVTTAKIAGLAITQAEIANGAVGQNQLATGAVLTAKIADEAVTLAKLPHGTGSNDGKFLRANNGADPTFETVTGTTINNNANNKLITGSGTANTLEAESSATYDGTKLFLSGGSGSDGHINMLELKHLNTASSTGGGTGDGPALLLNGYYANNEWAMAKIAADNVGYGFGGALEFWVHPANSTQTASVIKAADIIGDGTGANLTITDGNVKIGTAGHGIDFSATSNGPSMNSELLDDYEEGTWTPVANGFTSAGTYHANYTKIGRTVHITLWIQTAAGSSGSPFYISGLPFTVRGGSNCYQYMCGRLGSGSYTNSTSDIVFEFTPNNTTIFPKVQDGGMNWGMASNTHVMVTGTYITDT